MKSTLSINKFNSNSVAVESMIEKHRSGALPPPPNAVISKALKSEHVHITWLAGDGSDRCYYRVEDLTKEKSYVLMQLSGHDADALKDGGYEWIHMANTLESHGVIIPSVVATIPEYAALIIQDYGNLMLECYTKKYQSDILSDIVFSRYEIAIKIICKFLKIPKDSNAVWCKRSFDKERLKWELNFFKEKYIEGVANIEFTKDQETRFKNDVDKLSDYLGSYSKYFVHRDYHSRNLMITKEFMAVLDFQDARLGPPAYDVVSLIFDSYVPLANEQRLQLLEHSLDLIESKVGIEVRHEVEKTWKVNLLHRQLKAIGSFGYLTTEKNRGDYLRYVSPALMTLIDNDVADERWDFISNELPQMMLKNLGD